MANLVLNAPENNQNIVLPLNDDITSIDLSFAIDEALFEKVDDNLEIYFEESDSIIVLEDFYSVFNSENVPNFLLDNGVLSGEDFFSALDANLMPAAGNESVVASNDGLGFDAPSSENLAEGIDVFGDTAGGSNYTRNSFDGIFANNDSELDPTDAPTDEVEVLPPFVSVSVDAVTDDPGNIHSFSDNDTYKDMLTEVFDTTGKADLNYQTSSYDVVGYKPNTPVTSLDFEGFTISAQLVKFSDDGSYELSTNPSDLTFVYREDNSDNISSSSGLGITSSSDKNNSTYESGFNASTDQSEMFVIELDKSAEKVEIELGTFFDSHAQDSVPETALVELYDAAGNLIRTVTIEANSTTGEGTYTFTEIEGISEIRIMPSDNGTNSSDFTLEGITVYDTVQTVTGQVDVQNFGDGIEYEIGTINGMDISSLTDSTGKMTIDGIEYDYTKSDDNTSIKVSKDGDDAFSLEIDANGSYTLKENEDLGIDLELSFNVKNENGQELATEAFEINDDTSYLNLLTQPDDASLPEAQAISLSADMLHSIEIPMSDGGNMELPEDVDADFIVG